MQQCSPLLLHLTLLSSNSKDYLPLHSASCQKASTYMPILPLSLFAHWRSVTSSASLGAGVADKKRSLSFMCHKLKFKVATQQAQHATSQVNTALSYQKAQTPPQVQVVQVMMLSMHSRLLQLWMPMLSMLSRMLQFWTP